MTVPRDLSLDDLGARLRRAFPLSEAQALLQPRYRGGHSDSAGFCYLASEVLYHALGGKQAGYTPMFVRHEDAPHWYLQTHEGEILDVTADQFATPVPYVQGRGKGFLTRTPSRRAMVLADLAGISLLQSG
jgi:hypothetical protein